jgi:hypothetical protein
MKATILFGWPTVRASENPPLARAERRNPLSCCRGFAILSRRPRHSQGLPDRAEEAFIVTRLSDEIDRTRLHRLHGGRHRRARSSRRSADENRDG